MFQLIIGLCLFSYVQLAAGECANACNGHGKCTSYDMCICQRNWQAADCSERVCQFGLAHVDTPKGDLDGSGTVLNANSPVIENHYVYPYGTTEQFPSMQNSDLHTLTDTAHYYMECSNKGRCDRSTGECQCFDGYDGVACQRASCPGYPNSCSGHGVCKTISQLAQDNSGNVYKLWDKDATMGCACDHGYFGPDCSQRRCKVGVDPLYLDDAATVKYSIWDVAILSTKASVVSLTGLFTNGENGGEGQNNDNIGTFALRVFDSNGEDWVTEPLRAGATCSQVVAALERLPNNVIPSSTLKCTLTSVTDGSETTFSETSSFYDAQHPSYRLKYKMWLWDASTSIDHGELAQDTFLQVMGDSYDDAAISANPGGVTPKKISGYIYRLKFYGNPGALKQPEVEVYLDGKSPTIVSPGGKVITKVWTDGQQGEDNDYFADYCDGVTVTLATHGSNWQKQTYLTGFTTHEKSLLKKCLGGSDRDDSNNVEVYNWDYGNKYYPHIVKLVRTVTSYTDGGYYAVLYHDASITWDNTGTAGTFILLNPFAPPDAMNTDNYNVYTTKGTLALTSSDSQVTVGFGSNHFFTANVTYDVSRGVSSDTGYYDGDISCEVGAHNSAHLNKIHYDSVSRHCLNVGDIFTYLNWAVPIANPPHINLYTVERLATLPYQYNSGQRFNGPNGHPYTLEMHYGTHEITTDLAANWAVSVGSRTYPQSPNNTAALIGNFDFYTYKFYKAPASTYNYVAECSNRGICDRDTGVCKCFPGYTQDNCFQQSSLAV